MVVRLNARSPSAAMTWWSWWMSCTLGWKTASGCHSSHSATSNSRMSCRRCGNVRTSKSCTVRFSAGIPSSAVASFTSRASVSGAKPSGRERVAIENATYRTSEPSSTRRAIVPPAPNSPSSVCGASTSTRSQDPITRPFLSREAYGAACGAAFRTRELCSRVRLKSPAEPLELSRNRPVGFVSMPHGDLAQLAAVVGAVGAAMFVLSRTRLELLAGLCVVTAGEAALAVALIPGRDLKLLVNPVSHLLALVLGVLLVSAAAAALVRYTDWVPIVLLAAAPFRISTSIGEQKAYLLVPLYIVLAASLLALLVRALRGDVGRPLQRILAVPAAAFLLLAGLSLIWTRDLRQGSIELLFFLFPFSALVVAVARSPFRRWHPRALAATLVALGVLFSGVALFQRLTHGHLLAGDVARANAYTTYFRVTSLFKDPSVFGRNVVIAIAVLLVAVWLARIRFWVGAALIAFLWAGLLFSYSQSSFVALFAVGVAISFVLGVPRLRRVLLVGAAACVLGGVDDTAATAVSDSARKATSGRTRLARVTWVVFTNHPLVGVGIGGQPKASKEEAKTQL